MTDFLSLSLLPERSRVDRRASSFPIPLPASAYLTRQPRSPLRSPGAVRTVTVPGTQRGTEGCTGPSSRADTRRRRSHGISQFMASSSSRGFGLSEQQLWDERANGMILAV